MEVITYPTFSDIFPNEEVPSLSSELKNLPSDGVIHACCFWMGYLFLDPFGKKINHFLVSKMINTFSSDLQESVLSNLNKFYGSVNNPMIGIFPIYNILNLIMWEITNYRKGEINNQMQDYDYHVFRGLLIINQQLQKSFKNIKVTTDRNVQNITFIKGFWPSVCPTYEFNKLPHFLYELYEAVQFFDFLNTQTPFKKYINEFLKVNNSTTSKEYLSNIFDFIMNGHKKEKGLFAYCFPKDLLDKNPVLEQFVLNPVNEINIDSRDFKTLRQKPIIKDSNGAYLVSAYKHKDVDKSWV